MDYDAPMSIDDIDAAFDANPGIHDLVGMSGQQDMPYRTNYTFTSDGVDHYTIWAGDKCFIEYTFDELFTTIFITYFYCEGESAKTGAKMLHDLLILLKNTYPKLTSIILTADARVDYNAAKTKSIGNIETDQAKLNQYYTNIGFIKRNDGRNIFDGDIDTIRSTIRSTIFGGKKNKRTFRNKRSCKRTLRNKRNRNKKTRKKYSKYYR
jgi:hypothetical protein